MTVHSSSKKITSKVLMATAIAGFGLTAATGGAFAYGQKYIDSVQAREAAAIEQGRYSGALTRREYRDLKAEQDSIREMERRAQADGYVSKREYSAISEAQRNAGRHIYQEAHDGQTSWYRRWLYRTR